MAKLGHAYTTNLPLKLNVDGERFQVECVAEGLGTNLLKYRVTKRGTVRMSISELRYKRLYGEAQDSLLLDSASLQGAISSHLNDVRILSVEGAVRIFDPRKR